jgi:hypothetical protein
MEYYRQIEGAVRVSVDYCAVAYGKKDVAAKAFAVLISAGHVRNTPSEHFPQYLLSLRRNLRHDWMPPRDVTARLHSK